MRSREKGQVEKRAEKRFERRAVVRDRNLITSRTPNDLHLFAKEIVRALEL